MFQPGHVHSDSGCLLFKIKKANNTMCVGDLLEFDFNLNNFVFVETFLLSHDAIEAMLCDDDDGDFDPDSGGKAMEIVFTPEGW